MILRLIDTHPPQRSVGATTTIKRNARKAAPWRVQNPPQGPKATFPSPCSRLSAGERGSRPDQAGLQGGALFARGAIKVILHQSRDRGDFNCAVSILASGGRGLRWIASEEERFHACGCCARGCRPRQSAYQPPLAASWSSTLLLWNGPFGRPSMEWVARTYLSCRNPSVAASPP